MHSMTCHCPTCRGGVGKEFETLEFELQPQDEGESEDEFEFESDQEAGEAEKSAGTRPPAPRRSPGAAKPTLRYLKDFSGPASECSIALRRAGKTRAQALAIIDAQIGSAIAMLRKAASGLKRGSRTSRTRTRFQSIFRVKPEFVPTWLKTTASIRDRGDVVGTRCRRVADLLASGAIKFFCTINSTNCPDCGNDASDFACSSWGDESKAPKDSRVVCLGNPFWDDMRAGKTSSLLATLMHEPFHIYYGKVVTAHQADRGKFGGINCIVQFVFDINGRVAPNRVKTRCLAMAVRATPPKRELDFEGEYEDEDEYEDEAAFDAGEDESPFRDAAETQDEYQAEEEGADEAESGSSAGRGRPGTELATGLLTLAAAIADPRAAGPGVYTLFNGGQRLYVGRSSQLRRRLQQHLWCLTHLHPRAERAALLRRFQVKLTPLRGAEPAHLRRVEAAVIDRFGRQSQGGLLANVKARELEQELWGEAWQ